MAVYNVHAGHAPAGGLGSGATALLEESVEARKVKDKVISILRQQGNTVYDCTCNENKSQSDVLTDIVNKCNSHAVELDVSIHLNAGRNDYAGDGVTGGVEVYGYDDRTYDVGSAICNNISESLGVRSRGFKINKELYVLKKTKAQAILIECIFLDDKDDVDKWNVDKCALAIVEGILGRKIDVINPQVEEKDNVNVTVHIENKGWLAGVNIGSIAGTTGQSLQIEAIKIISKKQIKAKAHLENIGWVDYGIVNNGTLIGTVGQHRAIECICLTGDFQYRVHIQNFGWSAWTRADGIATLGTVGKSLQLEAIQLKW